MNVLEMNNDHSGEMSQIGVFSLHGPPIQKLHNPIIYRSIFIEGKYGNTFVNILVLQLLPLRVLRVSHNLLANKIHLVALAHVAVETLIFSRTVHC